MLRLMEHDATSELAPPPPSESIAGGAAPGRARSRDFASARPRTAFIRLLAVLVFVATAYLARDILLPLAVAGVLALVLGPIVGRMERWGLPNGVSVLSVVGMTMTMLIALGVLVSSQAVSILDSLPRYRSNIHERVLAVVRTDSGVIGRTAELVGDIKREIEQEAGAAARKTAVQGEAAAEANTLVSGVIGAVVGVTPNLAVAREASARTSASGSPA